MAKRGRPKKVQTPEAVAPTPAPEAVASVSRQIASNPEPPVDEGKGLGIAEGEEVFQGYSSEASMVQGEDVEQIEEETEETGEATLVAGEGEEVLETTDDNSDGLILGRFKTQEDLQAAYRNAEAELTRKSQEAAEQDRFYKDIIKNQAATKEEVVVPEIGEEFGDKLYNDPAGAAKDMAAVVAQQVQAQLEAQKAQASQKEQAHDAEITEAWLMKEHSAIMNDPDNQAMLHGLANAAPPDEQGSYRSRYEYATRTFKKAMEGAVEKATPIIAQEQAEVANMKNRARMESSSGKTVGPLYTYKQLETMIIEDPDRYSREQNKIRAAHLAGRVR